MRFTVLGAVSVRCSGEERRPYRARTRGLLGYLMMHAGHSVSTGALIEALWGGAAPRTARGQVHSALTEIRGCLAGSGGVLTATPNSYRLVVPEGQLDVAVFEKSLRLAREAVRKGDDAAGAGLLVGALGLWAGEPFEGASGAYVEAARARLGEQRLCGVEDLAALRIRTGDPEDAVTVTGPLVDRYPLRERLRARHVAALYAAGCRAEALHGFRAYRAVLRDREGLDPGPEITRLAEGILRAQVSV
ncbi:AfsR/SARP family transcriptional regulator [Actinoplanes sp. NPDC051861]|uniref:AfsR/SARP family transcriptional regulator n=1 Tax=Actinoplanes sp. NPDC051861 TaxID=3155170 RepID=UPI003424F1A7